MSFLLLYPCISAVDPLAPLRSPHATLDVPCRRSQGASGRCDDQQGAGACRAAEGGGTVRCALCAVRCAEGRFGFNSLMAISHKLGFPWPSGADVARGLKPSCFCGKFP